MSEIFGPTFQGEGPSLGRRCAFLRLGGCNLHCSWCDTPYTWDWAGRNGHPYDARAELTAMTPAEVMDDLASRGVDMLVVSGGEPLLQQVALLPLLSRVRAAGWSVEIETAGTIAPRDALVGLVSQFNVSPKLAHSGNSVGRRYRPDALDALQQSGRAVWKFVVGELGDLAEVDIIVKAHGLSPVYIMPEGTSTADIVRGSREVADAVLARGWQMTTRLHVLLWGGKRGV